MNLQRIINPFLTVFDEGLYPFSVYETLQKRKKGFIIRCKFINLYFFQCIVTYSVHPPIPECTFSLWTAVNNRDVTPGSCLSEELKS